MNIEWVRGRVRYALADTLIAENGQLGNLAEKTRVETSRFNRNPPRFLSYANGRMVRVPSSPVKAKQARVKGKSVALMLEYDYALVPWRRALASCPGVVPWRRALASCPGVVPWRRALASCPGVVPWRRAIGCLDEPLQAWIRYCYGDYMYHAEQLKVLPYVWQKFSEQQPGRISGKVKQRLQGLALLAVQVVAREIDGRPKRYTYAELADMVGVCKCDVKVAQFVVSPSPWRWQRNQAFRRL